MPIRAPTNELQTRLYLAAMAHVPPEKQKELKNQAMTEVVDRQTERIKQSLKTGLAFFERLEPAQRRARWFAGDGMKPPLTMPQDIPLLLTDGYYEAAKQGTLPQPVSPFWRVLFLGVRKEGFEEIQKQFKRDYEHELREERKERGDEFADMLDRVLRGQGQAANAVMGPTRGQPPAQPTNTRGVQ